MKNKTATCVSLLKTRVTCTVPVLASVLIFLIPYSSFAQKKISLESVPVNFVAKNAGLKVNGKISGLQGFLLFDTTDSTLLKIEGSVDANTIETGIGLRDSHLKKDEYLSVEKFPRITIISTAIDHKTNDQYVGRFDLTIKKIKKNITVPFKLSRTGQIYILKAAFKIDRQDFQVGGSSFLLSDDVIIQIDFKTTP
jgi:polyisoprenoid-binding protein YceI